MSVRHEDHAALVVAELCTGVAGLKFMPEADRRAVTMGALAALGAIFSKDSMSSSLSDLQAAGLALVRARAATLGLVCVVDERDLP